MEVSFLVNDHKPPPTQRPDWVGGEGDWGGWWQPSVLSDPWGPEGASSSPLHQSGWSSAKHVKSSVWSHDHLLLTQPAPTTRNPQWWLWHLMVLSSAKINIDKRLSVAVIYCPHTLHVYPHQINSQVSDRCEINQDFGRLTIKLKIKILPVHTNQS